MSKIYIQEFKDAYSASGVIPSGGSISGSFISEGYAKLVGMVISNASAKAGSGLRVYQSSNYGRNWDYYTDYVPSACSACGILVDIFGDAVKIEYRTDSQADIFRMAWHLRPI